LVRLTAGDQPDSVPFSLAKMKALPPLTPFWVTWNVAPLLKTMPVGLDGPALPGGIATTRVCGTPLPSYRVEVALPLFATQTKPVGLKAMPQALTRLGRRVRRPLPLSATRVRVANALAMVGVTAAGVMELIGIVAAATAGYEGGGQGGAEQAGLEAGGRFGWMRMMNSFWAGEAKGKGIPLMPSRPCKVQ
jgi:hypothetical protein